MTTSPSMFKWTIFSLTLLFCTPSFAKKVYGTFRVVKRDVKVISFKKKKTISARPGMKVYPKDTIVAGKNSRAKVVMVDKNVINISPDTKVNFANYVFEPKKKKKAVLLNVLYGKIRSKVNQKYNGKDNKFQVKTPSAVAGVRGTDFFVNYNRQIKKTDVVTFEGKVKFGLPGANNSIRNGVDVNVGQIASSTSGQRPNTPKNIPPSQLAKFDKNSNSDKAGEPDRKEPAPKNKPKKTKKKKENQPKKEPKAQADDKSAKNDKKDPAKAKGDKAPKKQNAANEPKNEPKRANAQGKKPNGPSPTATNNSAAPPKPGDGSTPGKSPTPNSPSAQAATGAPGLSSSPDGARRPASFSPAPGGEPLLRPEDVVSFEPQTDIGVFDGAFDPANNIDSVAPTDVLDQAADVLQNCQTCRDVANQGRTKLNIVIEAQ